MNMIIKTLIAVLLAALAGHPIAKAQTKKIIIRIESDSAKRDSIALDSMMKKMEISLKKIESKLDKLENIEMEISDEMLEFFAQSMKHKKDRGK